VSDVRPTREQIQQERVEAGLHPKAGWQSLAEQRRVLATWSKADLIEFQIREESDALKAIDRAIAAEQSLREHRAASLTLSKPRAGESSLSKLIREAFELWAHSLKGRDFMAETVFAAGWKARDAEVAAARATALAEAATIARQFIPFDPAEDASGHAWGAHVTATNIAERLEKLGLEA
jgi:hypothetical protein